MGFFASLLAWFQGLFFTKTAEISIVGLQASGKTSLVNVLTSGQWSEEVVPTVAFNLRKGKLYNKHTTGCNLIHKTVRKGNVTFKIWDVAGQPKFRNMWERYCRGVDAIVFMVDSSAIDKLESACFELHSLLDHQPLSGVPLLVLGNKNDLPDHASVDELIRILRLETIRDRTVSCYSCSMRSQHNLDIVIRWLSDRAK